MTSDPLILAFDTSGPWCSAVLMRGQCVLGEFYEDMPKGQAERLFPVLEECLAQGGADWRDLTAIGVGVGPGNFTGIRISVASARGLALGLGVQAVGVDMLDALALNAQDPVISAIAAPRDQVYVAGYGTKTAIEKQMMALSDVPNDWSEPDVVAIGTGAEPLAAILGLETAPPFFAPASAIARIAATRFAETKAAPVPLYLKPPDAAPSRIAAPVILDHDA